MQYNLTNKQNRLHNTVLLSMIAFSFFKILIQIPETNNSSREPVFLRVTTENMPSAHW